MRRPDTMFMEMQLRYMGEMSHKERRKFARRTISELLDWVKFLETQNTECPECLDSTPIPSRNSPAS